jgi:Peptidase M1 N-terminal domain
MGLSHWAGASVVSFLCAATVTQSHFRITFSFAPQKYFAGGDQLLERLATCLVRRIRAVYFWAVELSLARVMERLLLLMLFVGVWAVEDLNVRLPGSIVAEHYRIKMITVLQEGDFRLVGSLRMDFTVKESTDQVVMHAINLTVVEDSVNIITLSRGDPRSLSVEELLSIVEESSDSRTDSEPIRSQSVVYDAENEFVIIRLTSALIENRRYRINFNYRGKLSDGLKGFYRSHYIDRSTSSRR